MSLPSSHRGADTAAYRLPGATYVRAGAVTPSVAGDPPHEQLLLTLGKGPQWNL